MSNTEFCNLLSKNGIKYECGYSLKESSSFRIGGRCALAVFPENAETFALLLQLADSCDARLHVSGRASNTLFGDGELDLCVVFTAGVNQVFVSGTTVFAGAGTGLISLCSTVAKAGLSGLEFASGIPGSVGGAVVMNAGAYGGCMADVITLTRAYDRRSGSVMTLAEHGFGYRESIYKSDPSLICLEAKLCLKEDSADAVKERMRELLESRREKQPLEYPSAGSYFKRPQGDFAGRLIEVCGLKGMQIGGARVSEKHAGFIVNVGNATFDDVMRLEELVRATVLRETGVELEREVEIVR